MKYWICAFLLYAQLAAAESKLPIIKEIVFEGNDTTQEKTMRREMSIHEGDPADPRLIERSRQAIQDLNLFKYVGFEQSTLPDGSVKLIYKVKEKFYILPYPRLSYNDAGAYSYGATVRLDNLWGINHSAHFFVSRGDPNLPGYGKDSTYEADYSAPFIWDTPNTFSISVGHSVSAREDETTKKVYQESFDSLETLLTRTYSTSAASQGWSLGGGLRYQHENRYGPGAPPPYGGATALVGVANYRDLHSKIYSEEGRTFGVRAESAVSGLGSDYSYTAFSTRYDRYIALGQTPHQTLQIATQLATYFNGPADVNHYSLGGTGSLYGYKSHNFEGDALYYAAAIYERPIGWDWLRGLTALELGNVSRELSSDTLGRVQASVAVGLRVRVVWLVNFELEAGYAIPLNGGSWGRAYAGRVN